MYVNENKQKPTKTGENKQKHWKTEENTRNSGDYTGNRRRKKNTGENIGEVTIRAK